MKSLIRSPRLAMLGIRDTVVLAESAVVRARR